MQTDDVSVSFALTPEQPSFPAKVSRATWVGLAISLFAMLVIRQVVAFLIPGTTFASAILKEAMIWLSAATLLVIIRRGERLPMRSIGLGTARWWKSILWGFIIAIVSAVAVGALAYLTGYGHGPGSAAFEKLPLWLITAIVFRAGVVEELFYRGYAIERLHLVGSGPVLVGCDSAGYFFVWPLVGWRGQHPHRVRRWLNPDWILFVASRSGGEHDRSRHGGFRC